MPCRYGSYKYNLSLDLEPLPLHGLGHRATASGCCVGYELLPTSQVSRNKQETRHLVVLLKSLRCRQASGGSTEPDHTPPGRTQFLKCTHESVAARPSSFTLHTASRCPSTSDATNHLLGGSLPRRRLEKIGAEAALLTTLPDTLSYGLV